MIKYEKLGARMQSWRIWHMRDRIRCFPHPLYKVFIVISVREFYGYGDGCSLDQKQSWKFGNYLQKVTL